MSSLALLVSYPKSGNTWARAMITSVLADGGDINLNRLRVPNGASRNYCDQLLGISTMDLTHDEMTQVRPRVYAYAADNIQGRTFLKFHDAWLPQRGSKVLPIARESIDTIAYIVRDPRDVAVSFSKHLGRSIDETITLMGNPDGMLVFGRQGVRRQLPQRMSSWSAHVSSWVNSFPGKVCLLRYEDMLADAQRVFTAAFRFMRVRVTPEVLGKAIEATRFDVLSAKEDDTGFVERPRHNQKFFRRGVANGWQDSLTPEQVRRIETDHGDVMRALGYQLTAVEPRAVSPS